MNTVYCIQCKKELENSDTFCKHCGANQQSPRQAASVVQPARTKTLKAYGVVMCVVLLAIIGAGYFVLQGRQYPAPASQPAVRTVMPVEVHRQAIVPPVRNPLEDELQNLQEYIVELQKRRVAKHSEYELMSAHLALMKSQASSDGSPNWNDVSDYWKKTADKLGEEADIVGEQARAAARIDEIRGQLRK